MYRRVIVFVFMVNFLLSCDAAETKKNDKSITAIHYFTNDTFVVAGDEGYKSFKWGYRSVVKGNLVNSLVVSSDKKHACVLQNGYVLLYEGTKKLSTKLSDNLIGNIALNDKFLLLCNEQRKYLNYNFCIMSLYNLQTHTYEQKEIKVSQEGIVSSLSLHPCKNECVYLCDAEKIYQLSFPFDNKEGKLFSIDIDHQQNTGGKLASVQYSLEGDCIFINTQKKGYGFFYNQETGKAQDSKVCYYLDQQGSGDAIDSDRLYHISIAFHKNDIAAILRYDGKIQLWNYKTKKLIIEIPPKEDVEMPKYFSCAPSLLAFSPDGTRLSVAISDIICSYYLNSNNMHGLIESHLRGVAYNNSNSLLSYPISKEKKLVWIYVLLLVLKNRV